MRNLTSVQKKLLKKAVKKYYDENKEYPETAEFLPEYDAIEAINPTEIFWQNANRYVMDLRFEEEFNYMFRGGL